MIGSESLCGVISWSSIDGEQFVGDQEQYFDEQDRQEYFEQGKYSMGSSLLSYLPFNYLVICMCQFVTQKDILVIVILFLITNGLNLHMGSLLALNINIHDLNNE
jgi:hypothetical protein